MAKTTKTAAVVENPETALVQREGSAIIAFITSLMPFLKRAQELEVRALEALQIAKGLRQPKTAEEDDTLKNQVRLWKADTKETEEHWEICQAFSRFHKRLTGKRGVAVDALKEAVRLGTNHHEAFVQAENRRIAKEAEDKRLAEEKRAADERKKELEELEAKALAAEEALEGLSEREQRFVDCYVANGGNATRAAAEAGYKDPLKQGQRLLTFTKIHEAVGAKHNAEALRREADQVRATPLETKEIVVESQANTQGDRKSKTAVVLDEKAFIAAVISGSYGIPLDCLTVNQTRLNACARDFGEIINRWPGIRYKESTSIV